MSENKIETLETIKIKTEVVENKAIESLTVETDAVDNKIKLVSKDGKEFLIDKKYTEISGLIVTALTDIEEKVVDLPSVNGDVLELIVKYLEHHKGVSPPIIERPLKSKIMKEVCADIWDAEFIDTFEATLKEYFNDLDKCKKEDKSKEANVPLFQLLVAANYMDIQPLLHLACAKTAGVIKGEPIEKMKVLLNKSDDESDSKSDNKNIDNNDSNTISNVNNIDNNDSNNIVSNMSDENKTNA